MAGLKHGVFLKFDFRLYVILGFVVVASTALTQTSGTFTPTGNMITPRLLHTATLLADGRVLIAGGEFLVPSGSSVAFKSLATAELYDPTTGTFTLTGNMSTPRCSFTATLLSNGKVLIAGGQVSTGALGYALASAELYDPDAGTFTSTGSMTMPRSGHTATLLRNGKVLIAGTFLGTSAELYDPSTGTFTATGDMATPWADTATMLPSGKVLITKGNPDYGPYFSSGELYDTATGTFASAGYMTTNHTGPTATSLVNGKVLIDGGDIGDGDGASVIAELYDPATGTFTATGKMIAGREQNTTTLLSDGTVLVAGGHNVHALSATAEVYDPAAGTFAPTGGLSGPRELHTATLLKDGRVLITGGDDERYWIADTILASAELYCPVNANCPPDAWQQAAAAMKTAAGTDSLNFWQWAYYWQNTPTFAGAPNGFGVSGSISPEVMDQTTKAGGGNVLLNISAEQWVLYYRRSTTAVSGVLNAASHVAGAIAPGEMIVVTGSGLGPATAVSAASNIDGLYASQLAGTTVLVNGAPVPIISTSATQVQAVVPDSLAGGTAQVTVAYQGQTSAPFPVPVAPAAPGIFTVDSTGQGHAASINQNGLVNTSAHWGDVLTLFATGLGRAASSVTIHGFNLSANPISVGTGTVPGVIQIKVPIPVGQDCDTQVVIQVGDASSQAGVTIAMDICI